MGVQSQEYRIRKRREALMALGGRCVHCGKTDWRVLQIDHIYGGGTQEFRKRRSTGTITRYLQIIAKPNIEKLQVLCANCNWRKRYEEDESSKRY